MASYLGRVNARERERGRERVFATNTALLRSITNRRNQNGFTSIR